MSEGLCECSPNAEADNRDSRQEQLFHQYSPSLKIAGKPIADSDATT
jgi:hypothetical protein